MEIHHSAVAGLHHSKNLKVKAFRAIFVNRNLEKAERISENLA